MDESYDIVIIGGGPTGMYSGICAGLRHHRTLIIECSDKLGGKLNNYPHKKILDIPGSLAVEAQVFLKNMQEQLRLYQDFVSIVLNDEVKEFTNNGTSFILKISNKVISTKTIVLANGMGKYTPRKLELVGNNAKNIYYYFNNPFEFANKEVVILGGGDSALDYCLMLQDVASKVTLIHRRDNFRAKEELLAKLNKKVQIKKPYVISEIKTIANKATDIIITKTDSVEMETISFDALIVAYGMMPNIDLFTNLVVYDSRGISVNINKETAVENIFAVGDACFYLGKYKNITSGLGEAANVINYISNKLRPEKVAIYYSSISKQ